MDLKTYLGGRASLLTRREKLISIFSTGLFIFVFLVFFQPFGVNNYNPEETISPLFFIMMLVNGMLVIIVLGINEFLIYPLIFRKLPKRFEMVLWIIWTMVWLSTWVFLYYNFAGNWHDFYWSSYFEFIGNVSTLLIIPFAVLIFYIRVRDLNQQLLKRPLEVNSENGEKLVAFIAENGKDHFQTMLKNILFIESEDNYIGIHFMKDKQASKVLLRKSLKELEDEIESNLIIRCHRSFMVNLMQVEQVSGNRRKMILHMAHINKEIPVSRLYFEKLENILKSSH